MNIVLIGYRGCGKTAVGGLLATRLGFDLITMDDEIIKLADKQIPEIVAQFGWDHFRDLESKVAKDVGQRDRCVIDTGGGVVMRQQNIKELGRSGKIVWLKADILTIKKRIRNDNQRPSLTGQKNFLDEIEEVLKERKPLYEKYADLVIDTSDLSIEKVVEKILDQYHEVLKN